MASEFVFEAIGTAWKIVINDDLPAIEAARLLAEIRERIHAFDTHYSRFRDDSLVMQMSREAGIYTLPSDAEPLFDLYKEVYELTGGLVTPLIGQLLSDAGYDASYSLTPQLRLIAPPRWEDALRYEFPKLQILTPVLLDLGAAGKGYLVDIVSDIIREAGVSSFVVNAGGDICAYDEAGTGIRVALEHPDDPAQAIGVATIANSSICGSSGNRRRWGEYHHIMNPETLSSPSHIRALWVVADSTLLADALATCLFFTNPSILNERYRYEYLILNDDYAVEKSNGFPAELFTS